MNWDYKWHSGSLVLGRLFLVQFKMIKLLSALFIIFLIIYANAAPITEDEDLKLKYFEYGREGELGEYFEGDMLLSPEQHRAIFAATAQRNGLRGGAKRWPKQTVVYDIQQDDFDEKQIKMIKEAMADIANKSCIKFVSRKSDEEHAVIIQGSSNGCFSSVGFNRPDKDEEDRQVLNLSKGCFRHGTVVHEMLHTLGFYHMQSTYDRDDFVKIIWENISPGTEHNFAKYTNDTVTDFGVPYDYGSVMHYTETSFSKNGNKTIVPLQDGAKIGQRNGLSENDILKLNRMYCKNHEDAEVAPRS